MFDFHAGLTLLALVGVDRVKEDGARAGFQPRALEITLSWVYFIGICFRQRFRSEIGSAWSKTND